MAAAGRRPFQSKPPDVLTRRGRLIAALGIFLVTGGAALPGVGPTESRVRVDVAAAPWSSIVRLQIPGVSRCTGVLIAPDLVATAAHCLWGRRLGHFAPASAIHILAGYADGAFTAHRVAASVAMTPGYDPEGPAGAGSDIAVVTLAAALPGPALSLWDGPVPPGTPVMLAGYGQDRAERLMADTGCTARSYGEGPDAQPILIHTCAGTRGTSGGPLLARAPDGTWRVAGIQAAARPNAAGGAAVPAAAVRALLPPR